METIWSLHLTKATKMSNKEAEKYSANQTVQRLNLTNRFYVAVSLFSNWSQMTSKCGKNKNVAHEAIAECVTDVLWSITEQTHENMDGVYP